MTALRYILFFAWIVYIISAPLSAGAVTSKTSNHKPTALVEIPIKIINNRVQFEMTASGVPLTFLLDTGATSSIYFYSDKLTGLALPTGRKAKIAFPAIAQSVVGSRISAITLKNGTFSFVSKNGLLLSSDTSIVAELEADYDVILGQEFFRLFTVEIDPEHLRMRLYAPGTDLTDHYDTSRRLYMEGHTPHIRFFSRLPWEVRGTSKAMLLDTGYPGSLVVWNKRHFRQADSSGQMVQRHDNSRGIVSYIKLNFGRLEFENIPVFIARSVPKQLQERDGLIGASILAQHRHVIDFTQEKLLMTPIYGTSGRPLQIIDGLVYTPNNENFDVKTYYPKIPTQPTLVIHANGEMGITR